MAIGSGARLRVILHRQAYRASQAYVAGSVSDPYSFFTDPDPDPEVEAGDQYASGYGSGSNPDPGL